MTSLVFAGALALAACGGGGSDEASSEPERPDPEPSEETTTTAAAPAAAESLVAQATGPQVEVFPEPGATEPQVTLDNPNENGAPLVFLVDWARKRMGAGSSRAEQAPERAPSARAD